MGSGKTTYARSLVGCRFISHDDELAKVRWNWKAAFRNIVAQLVARPEENFVIDGWFSIYNLDPRSVFQLQEAIPQTVQVTAFYAPLDHLLVNPRNTKRFIRKVYNYIMRFYRNELRDFKFAFRDWTRVYTFEGFSKLVRQDLTDATPQSIEKFQRLLEQQTHDRYYQTIHLPLGQRLEGDEDTEVFWDCLKQKIAWRGKTVVDIGSYHGYVDFGAIDMGAKYVLGVDKTPQAVHIARLLKKIWGYQDIDFMRADIDRYRIKSDFDIALCLNTIQYFTQPLPSVGKIFRSAKEVVFEAQEHYLGLLNQVAKKTQHHCRELLESPRWKGIKRMLYFYERGV